MIALSNRFARSHPMRGGLYRRSDPILLSWVDAIGFRNVKEIHMKRGWPLFLLVAVFGLVGINTGCHVDADDDDDASIEVDTKGPKKGVEIKND